MREENIEFNDSNDISAYNRALASHQCEYCLQYYYYYRSDLSSPIAHYSMNGKFRRWIVVCNSCKGQINDYEQIQLMKKKRAAIAELLRRSGFPLTTPENEYEEEPSAFFF